MPSLRKRSVSVAARSPWLLGALMAAPAAASPLTVPMVGEVVFVAQGLPSSLPGIALGSPVSLAMTYETTTPPSILTVYPPPLDPDAALICAIDPTDSLCDRTPLEIFNYWSDTPESGATSVIGDIAMESLHGLNLDFPGAPIGEAAVRFILPLAAYEEESIPWIFVLHGLFAGAFIPDPHSLPQDLATLSRAERFLLAVYHDDGLLGDEILSDAVLIADLHIVPEPSAGLLILEGIALLGLLARNTAGLARERSGRRR